MKKSRPVAALLLAVSSASLSAAQDVPRGEPMTAPLPAPLPDAVDTPWPGGTMALDIDASDVVRGVYRVTQTVPIAPGTTQITLLYPQWLPGNHGPRGPLAELVDLRFTANGKPLAWRRDTVEMNAFHVFLPAGTREVVARYVHTSPLQSAEGRITMTPDMLNLQWEKMSLYPAGHYVRRIRVRPSITLPRGWQAATSLDGQSAAGNRVSWAETDYETLVDSPIFAGAHFRRWDLGHGVAMNAVADSPSQLEAPPEALASMRALVEEALALFGSRHFDRYEFLVALSDKLGSIGLEHLRSSENRQEPDTFTNWQGTDWDHNRLSHELVHSWNGKYRRPADLWTPDYRQPMQGNLLWVYEGQTQFWGWILAARSGLQSRDMVLGMMASSAGTFADHPGRAWRTVEDTTHDPVFAARKAKPFASLARGEDYYQEGALIWLEADQLIRDQTGGARSLDDFARLFFTVQDGQQGQATYGFDDVVATLNAVHPHDWAGFLRQRMQQAGQPAPLAGIEAGGYRLAWRDEPNPYDKARMTAGKNLSLTFSLGLTLDNEGKVTATQWDGPAFNAGIVTGARIVAVNGLAYSAENIRRAITAAKDGGPIDLIVQRGDRFQTIPVEWRGGLRWPWLERTAPADREAGLDRLLAPIHPASAN